MLIRMVTQVILLRVGTLIIEEAATYLIKKLPKTVNKKSKRKK